MLTGIKYVAEEEVGGKECINMRMMFSLLVFILMGPKCFQRDITKSVFCLFVFLQYHHG